MKKIEINIDGFIPHAYYGKISDRLHIGSFFHALDSVKRKYGFEVIATTEIPRCSFAIDDDINGYIAYTEGARFQDTDLDFIYDFQPKHIFKFHYKPNLFDYSKYNIHGTIYPFGLYRPWNTVFDYDNLLFKNRTIDIMARMRCGNSHSDTQYWAKERKRVVEQAQRLQLKYNVLTGLTQMNTYETELLNSKIAYFWQGSEVLCWKIPEFIQQGVVMITQPLGANYKMLGDIILEDDVHCVYCEKPEDFNKTAIELLNDGDRLFRLRENVIGLWRDKLCPEKIGDWIFYKLVRGM